MARRRSRRSAARTASRRQPLDRLAVSMMAGLVLVLGLLIFSGDHATARVRDFSWQDRQVGAEACVARWQNCWPRRCCPGCSGR